MKRPVLQPTPEPGQVYEWDGGSGDQLFVILSVETSREIWQCQALDLQKGCETEVGIRRRERHNGWRLAKELA